MIRPVGVSAGGIGLLLAWFGGAAIAQLTGATPVIIVLAAGFVLFAAAIIDGFLSIRRTQVREITLPHSSVQGEAVAIVGDISAPRPVWIEMRSHDRDVAVGWTSTGDFAGDAVFAERGPIDHLEVRARSAGLLGLAWWVAGSTSMSNATSSLHPHGTAPFLSSESVRPPTVTWPARAGPSAARSMASGLGATATARNSCTGRQRSGPVN